MGRIGVVLVDDHPLFRQGLRRVLEGGTEIEVLGEVADGREALTIVKQLMPQVVIVDIKLPGLMNGLQLTHELKRQAPDIAVIVLTAYHDDIQMLHAMGEGAAAYFPKEVTPHQLVETIRLVLEGKYVIVDRVLDKAEMAAWLSQHRHRMGVGDGMFGEVSSPLSPREMEILQHVARGQSNKEVAYKLGISRQTVKNHMTNILRKLAVSDRTQAAVWAVRKGLV